MACSDIYREGRDFCPFFLILIDKRTKTYIPWVFYGKGMTFLLKV